jgi:hypothetical protein
VKHVMRSLRQYPHCFLNSYTFTNTGTENYLLSFYHVLKNIGGLTDVTYLNNTIDGVTLFSGEGFDAQRNVNVVSMNTYISDGCIKRGYNIFNSIVYNKFEKLLDTSTPFVFHILTATMTTIDFKNPKQELNKLLITIHKNCTLQNPLSDPASVLPIIILHNSMWEDIWKSDLRFESKLGNTLENASKLRVLQKNVRLCLFNILSSVRDDIDVDHNPLNISIIDKYGDVFWNGDMFLVPVLIILRPK